MNRKYYRFNTIWDVANFFNAISVFTMCEFWTVWNNARIAVVDSPSDQDLKLSEGYAKENRGKEIPSPY